ncbi:MAG: zinc-binding dehydrogenase [Planctomycetota bacterium]
MTHDSQAALFHGPNTPWELRSSPICPPANGQILVKVLACTICGSDLHTICGRRSAHTPAILGHEIVGQILRFGNNAPKTDATGATLDIGDRVVWTLVANCGQCYFCNHQLPQKCLNGYKYGHQQITDQTCWHGGFATHCTLLSGTHLVKVPDTISDNQAAPIGCATATIAAALRTANLNPHETVLVIGAGMLGLTACAFAKSINPRNLVCIELDPYRRSLADKFGATSTIAPNKFDLKSSDPDLQIGFDLVLECSGTNDGALEALHLVRIGGRIVLVGAVFPSQPAPIVIENIVRKQLTIQGVHNYQIKDLLCAVDFIHKNSREFPFESLVTHSFGLHQIDQAIRFAQDSRNIRVAIRP